MRDKFLILSDYRLIADRTKEVIKLHSNYSSIKANKEYDLQPSCLSISYCRYLNSIFILRLLKKSKKKYKHSQICIRMIQKKYENIGDLLYSILNKLLMKGIKSNDINIYLHNCRKLSKIVVMNLWDQSKEISLASQKILLSFKELSIMFAYLDILDIVV